MMSLVKKQFATLRFGALPLVMLVFLTVRTFTSGNGLMLAGICVGFLPFFTL